jgi:uncharacterized protein (TIGR02147 family)
MNNITYHDLLNQEFERRKQINNAYSLRAFARDLGISAPRLSQVLNRKQGISVEAAQNLLNKLKLSDEEKNWFRDSVGSLHSRSYKERTNFNEKVKRYQKKENTYSEIQLEYFKVISDWHHFAILELTYLEDFKYNHEWIAAKLGISTNEVKDAIKRLLDLDLIREEGDKLVDVFKFLATSNDIPSLSLKKFHSQLLKKALEALYEQPTNNREISSNIISIKKENLTKFKEKIRKFRKEIDEDTNNTNEKDAVYCLGIQFYELTGNNI